MDPTYRLDAVQAFDEGDVVAVEGGEVLTTACPWCQSLGCASCDQTGMVCVDCEEPVAWCQCGEA